LWVSHPDVFVTGHENNHERPYELQKIISYTLETNSVTTDDVSVLTATAVFLGAAVLVGAPVTVLLLGLFSALLDTAGVSISLGTNLSDTLVFLGGSAGALWLWLQISYEAAQLQLHGVEALSRGSRWAALARHLLLGSFVVGILVSLALFGVLWLLALVSEPSLTALVGSALGVATLGVFVRASRAFWGGFADHRSAG
jgi:hypothetical protein